jgi:unsaturated chondroitin disaccharide hydrolase
LKKSSAAFDFAGTQLAISPRPPDYFPPPAENGSTAAKHGQTGEGFLGGQLWLMVRHAGDERDAWREKAEHYSRLIEHRKTDRSVHDLGFLFGPTWKRWYDLTGDPAVNAVVIEAGRTMGLRFKEKGQYLCSFVADASLFIDIMMNVGIIFYAAQETRDADLLQVATQHCLTTRKYLVRGDGSTSRRHL